MKKYPKICKGCIYLHPHYANKTKTGDRTISSYFCSAKHGGYNTGKINPGLKQCDKRRTKDEANSRIQQR